MKKESAFIRIYRFYLEGFREMKLGKTLWLIILVKLFIMFFILRYSSFLIISGNSIAIVRRRTTYRTNSYNGQ